MAVKYSLDKVSQLQEYSFFVDANVLIYLFWPTGSTHWEDRYARVFRALLRQGNPLFVDFLVISEVVNRAIKAEYEKFLIQNNIAKSQLKYKDYRNSSDGKDALRDIYTIVRNNILDRFNVVGKYFEKQDIDHFLVNDELDFVDKAIVKICKENSLVILTNDKDFKNTDLDILTGNPVILH